MAYPHNFNPTGYTNQELADKYGVTVRTISNWKKAWREQLPSKPSVVYHHILTTDFVNVVRHEGSQVDSIIVFTTDERYPDVIHALANNTSELDKYFVQTQLKQVKQQTDDLVTIDENGVCYKGNLLTGDIANAITEMYLENRLSTDNNMVLFLDKLLQNPNKNVFEQLYSFLLHNDIKINNEGDILAFKKVQSSYKDIYSGKFDNRVGKVVKMERDKVDDNPDQTCSHGLHVCAKSYLESFGSTKGNDRVMQVKVNPKDVVSVPTDYNGAKMRVCEYVVIGEVNEKD